MSNRILFLSNFLNQKAKKISILEYLGAVSKKKFEVCPVTGVIIPFSEKISQSSLIFWIDSHNIERWFLLK